MPANTSGSSGITDSSNAVKISTVTGITSAVPAAVNSVVRGGGIKIYPTSAGTASVYISMSNYNLTGADIAAGNSAITNNTNAKWILWQAGAVSSETAQQVYIPLTTVAVVVTSGTWTLEITQ